MRLAAEAKLGFYPAHESGIAAICKHLYAGAIPKGAKWDKINIIDPCCGEGKAIHQIATHLGVAEENVYCVELDGGRAKATRELMPKANVLGPATFLGTQVSGFSMGLAYVNPPFAQELGGGRREEYSFVVKAAHLLATNGVLVLVAPLAAVNGNHDFCMFLDSRFEDIRVYKWPNAVRQYNEIVVIGRRRKVELPTEAAKAHGNLHQMEFQWRTYGWDDRLSVIGGDHYNVSISGRIVNREERTDYRVPPSWKPSTFKKIGYTDEELAEVLAASPLKKLLKEYVSVPLARPPLPPGRGHVGQMLASGMLDGVVESPYGSHVVRGTATKVDYISECSSTEDLDTGTVTTKTVISQKPTVIIRTVDSYGEIRTFGSEKPEDAESEGDACDEDAA